MNDLMKLEFGSNDTEYPRNPEYVASQATDIPSHELEGLFLRNQAAKMEIACQLRAVGLSMEAVGRILHLVKSDNG